MTPRLFCLFYQGKIGCIATLQKQLRPRSPPPTAEKVPCDYGNPMVALCRKSEAVTRCSERSAERVALLVLRLLDVIKLSPEVLNFRGTAANASINHRFLAKFELAS